MKKFISLFIILGMLFVVGNAFACGGYHPPVENVTVRGEGTVGHHTFLSPNGATGGQTWGSATYSYAGEDSGNIGSHHYYSHGPDVNGNGMATTYGKTWRNAIPNGVASHAVSSSYAHSSGGGSL